jgi:putative ABC transport system permease protein
LPTDFTELTKMDDLIRDLRFAARAMARKPGFTVTAVIIMALGIGANTAIFTLVRAVLLSPLPFKDPNRLAMIWEEASFIGFPRNTPAPANYIDWKTRSEAFEDMAAVDTRSFNLTGDGDPQKVQAYAVTGSFFSLLGVPPSLGRVIGPDDDRPDANKVAVISNKLWQSRYGGEPDVVGRDVLFSGEKYTIIGVMPKDFQFLASYVDVWVPVAMTNEEMGNRGNHYLEVIGRVKPRVTFQQADNDIKAIMAQIASDFPVEAGRLGAYVVPLHEEIVGETKRPLIVLLIAVALVLLIASANLANLLLSRALGRSKEIAVRSALGANRWRLARQLLTESVLLSSVGGATGVLAAMFSFEFLSRLIPPGVTLSADLHIDPLVLGVTLILSLLTGLVFGLAPALHASRIDLNEALKQGGGRTALSRGHRRLQGAMVVGEVALAVVLLTGAGLLIKTFLRLQGQYTAMQAESVLTVRTQLLESKYREAARRIPFYEQVLGGVASLPGVVAAGYTTSVPLEWKGGTNQITIEGRPEEPGVIYDANHRQVSEDYFKAIGIALREGRFFDSSDTDKTAPVAIVNETMARQFWPGENAIGKRFKHGGSASRRPFMTIVGVVADIRQMGMQAPVKAEMYMPYKQALTQPWYGPRDLVIRTSIDPKSLVAAVTGKVHEADPNQPVSNVRTMKEVLGEEFAQRETGTTLLAVFAGLALLLSTIGVYGVLTYFVSQRTPEFGVRMALGARRSDILALVMRRAVSLAVGGIVIGLAGSFALTRFMQSLLFEVEPNDPLALAAAVVLLLAASLVACTIPARRAATVDPMVALRHE